MLQTTDQPGPLLSVRTLSHLLTHVRASRMSPGLTQEVIIIRHSLREK